MLIYFLLLAIVITPVALLVARHEYRRRGHWSVIGLSLILMMFLAPNLILEYATVYEMPTAPLDYVGVLVGVAGLILCLVSMVVFRSPLKILCLDPGMLTIKGPYRWSRNPQYVGWFMFLLGFALNDWSWWCLTAMVIVAVYLHLLILIEEEHLTRVFGEPYEEYRETVSRYFGSPAAKAGQPNAR